MVPKGSNPRNKKGGKPVTHCGWFGLLGSHWRGTRGLYDLYGSADQTYGASNLDALMTREALVKGNFQTI